MGRPQVSQTVIDQFTKIVDDQDKKGFAKYGKSIDEAIDHHYNWELMALEETADLQKYLVRRIMQLEKQLNDYIDDVEQMEGMLRQANERIKELESNSPSIKKAPYADLDD